MPDLAARAEAMRARAAANEGPRRLVGRACRILDLTEPDDLVIVGVRTHPIPGVLTHDGRWWDERQIGESWDR